MDSPNGECCLQASAGKGSGYAKMPLPRTVRPTQE